MMLNMIYNVSFKLMNDELKVFWLDYVGVASKCINKLMKACHCYNLGCYI